MVSRAPAETETRRNPMRVRVISCCGAFVLALAVTAGAALAKGDLAVKAEKLEPLVLGSKESDYAMSVREYKLETGKAYRLKIISSGFKEYAIVAPRFFRDIWVRRVEVDDVQIKAAVIEEIKFDDEGEAELYFVPIRTGFYEFRSRGLEERGMIGKIIVK